VSKDLSWFEKAELMLLLFIQGMALAAWFVPMGSVLDRANHRDLIPFAFACSALAALLSPLFFGAMADRSAPPLTVLRWISVGTAVLNLLVAYAITAKLNGLIVLLGIQCQSLLSVPTNSLTISIVLARLTNSQKQFGAIRALGTFGWMAGCWLVSLFHVDASPVAFVMSSLLWLGLVAFTFLISKQPYVAQSLANRRMNLRERFGLDALGLLKVADHRVIFMTVSLIAIPFAAFYPYTPAHMLDLGLQSTSAWMSLGQVTEVCVMFVIGGILTKWRLKWIIASGLAFGVARYLLYACDAPIPLLFGVGLHGLAYTFIFISAQIYLANEIAPEWRTRAQALLSMLTSGIGSLLGYGLTGTWYSVCLHGQVVNWQVYWLGLGCVVGLVFLFFTVCYHGKRDPHPK
jgi:hypothetical protein